MARSRATFNVAAIDLGAESGRVFLVRYDGGTIALRAIYRFPNQPVFGQGHLHWDIEALWQEMRAGLRQARAEAGTIESIGVDSWGVDYGLVDANGSLLEQPFHYRDTRTQGVVEQVCARLSRERIYSETGIQFLPINTLYQLAAHYQAEPELFDRAYRLLLIPDLMHSRLSGVTVCEYTNATTTQMWSAVAHCWATDLIAAAGIPLHLLPPVVEPGTVLGPLLPALQDELGTGVRVVAPATHDTAAAVAAVPHRTADGWAYISSGTWSLVGLELPHPLIKPEALQANFTNEGGVFGTTRFLKNVMGLWLLQECRRTWAQAGQRWSYEQLFTSAAMAAAFTAFIDPDDSAFLAPGNMPARIQQFVTHHHEPPVMTPGALTRCILESLVLRYRQVLEVATNLAGTRLRVIHVVGGGSQSALMNQWLADATGLPVVAGPVEAAALGNALMQLVGLGELTTLAEVRALCDQATLTTVFYPQPDRRQGWDDAYARFLQVIQET